MIGQYLSNTNESATVSISQKILELNKALRDLSWKWIGEGGVENLQSTYFPRTHDLELILMEILCERGCF
jgi:hypothetical protein